MRDDMASLVSVIMPVYNGGKFLKLSIDSVLAQTYSNIELLIVDDGSIDGSEVIVEEYLARDSRVKFLKHEDNKGCAHARNTGLEYSRGELLAFIDQDDEWLPEKLAFQVECCRDLGCDVVASAVEFDYGDGNAAHISSLPAGKKNSKSSMYKFFLQRNLIPSFSCVLITRDVFREIGPIDESYFGADDYDYWLRCAKLKNIFLDSRCMVVKREHDENFSWKNPEKMLNDQLSIIKKFHERESAELAEYSRSGAFFSAGLKYVLMGRSEEARSSFQRSMAHKRNAKNLFFYCLSFFPSSVQLFSVKFLASFLHGRGLVKSRWLVS